MTRLSADVVALLRNPETPDYAIRDALLDTGVDVANVYVVVGVSGEYSDRTTWTVAAFLAEPPATALRDELNEWCRANGVGIGGPWMPFRDRPKDCPLDPGWAAGCAAGDTAYHVEAIPLRA